MTVMTGLRSFAAKTDGGFGLISRAKSWTYESRSSPQERVYAGARLAKQRIAGPTRHTGTIDGYSGEPPAMLFPGSQFTFLGYTGPTSGVPCTPGPAITFDALVEQLAITWNWGADNPGVTWSANIRAVGAVTVDPAYDDPCTDTVYCDENQCNLALTIKNPCNSNAVVAIPNITTAVLTFTRTVVEFSNQSTGCQIRSLPGTLDWTLDITDQNAELNLLAEQGQYWAEIEAKHTAPIRKWVLKHLMFTAMTGLRADSASGEPIGKTYQFSGQAIDCCASPPVRGTIIHPDGTVLWPYADP